MQDVISLSPMSATESELRDALIERGVKLLVEALPRLLDGSITPREQDHAGATFTHKFTSEDAYINPRAIISGDNPALVAQTWRQVRALNPKPGTWTKIKIKSQTCPTGRRESKVKDEIPKDLRIKIHSAHIEGGKLVPDLITPEGKKQMRWQDFLKGNELVN